MKSIDFTQLGGFPLTQERLDYLQQSYTECLTALGSIFKNGAVPVCISGMESSDAGGGVTDVSAGFVYYNGELIRFESGSYGAVPGGSALYVTVTEYTSPLTYNSGASHDSIIEKVAELTVLADTTVEDETHFLFTSVRSAAVAYAEANVDILNPPFISPIYEGDFIPDPVSPIGYRKAISSKRVVIKGVTNEGLPVSISSDTVVFTLPLMYSPSEEQHFLSFTLGGAPIVIRVRTDGRVSLAGDILGVGSTLGCWLNISFDVE